MHIYMYACIYDLHVLQHETPRMVARRCQKSRWEECVHLLQAHGAKFKLGVSTKDKGAQLLQSAQEGKLDTLVLLLEDGADINSTGSKCDKVRLM